MKTTRSSATSVGNASHGSFGLPQPTKAAAKPAIELVHRGAPTKKTSPTAVPSVLKRRDASTRSTDTVATPSSVHLIPASSSSTNSKPYSLSRVDLSDLSGSYHHGAAATTRSMNLPNMTWQHAKVLSRQRLPQHPQPYHMDDNESCSYGRESRKSSAGKSNHPTSISLMESGDTIEVCLPNISFVAAHNNNNNNMNMIDDDDGIDHPPSRQNHNKLPPHRIPLLLVLMDPQRKLYELLQLWIDTSIDTVRDILQTINKNIADHHHHHGNGNVWKQDYDGLFQVRNNHFSPLIHVLPAGKYDIVPGEVWVCQPWSMTSQQTVAYASTLLNHLKQRQILQYKKCSDFGPIWNQWKLFRHGGGPANNNNNKLDDTVLVLSRKATQRLYVPGGILKHYHACQFLSFSPPLEEAVAPTKTTTTTMMNDESQSTASGLSDSRCDDDEDDLLEDMLDDTDDDHDQLVTLDHDGSDNDMEPTETNRSSTNHIIPPESYQDHPNVKNVTHLLQQTCSTVTVEDDDEDDIATSSPLLPLPEDDRGHRRTTSNATVGSAKTKESTYMFRTYDEHKHSKSIWKTSSNTNHHYGSSNNRPIPHVLPSGSFGAFRDRTTPNTSTSSSSFQRMMRRLYTTVFNCRQESMLNRRSRSYDEQLYYTNSMNMNHTNNNNNSKYSNWKQRKSSGTTTRTTLLSDDASMGTTLHPYHHQNQPSPPQWRDMDTASHCSGVPLLLTSAPTADWVTHI